MKIENKKMLKNINSYISSYNLGNLEISKGGNFQDFLNLLLTFYCNENNEKIK